MIRRSLAIAAVVVVAGASVTACSGTETAQARAAKPSARQGGDLVVGITEPGAIDPANAFEPMGQLVARTICEPLLDFDPVSGATRPGLAESWQVSDEGSRYTVKIRKDVRFHDGTKLGADDVGFSLWRLASAEMASPNAALLSGVSGYPTVHGDQTTDEDEKREHLSGFRVIEGNSFDLTLATNNATFVRVLGHPSTAAVARKRAVADPRGFESMPVCTGPYRMTKPWRRGDPEIVLERFSDHHGGAPAFTRGGAGYADRIVFRIAPDRRTLLSLYREGLVDVIPLDRTQVGTAKDLAADLVKVPQGAIEMIGLPNGVAPFDDPRLRTALSVALDRQAVVDRALGGVASPAGGYVPPTVGAAYTEPACADDAPPLGDVERARRIVADSGRVLQGVGLKLYVNDEFSNMAVVREVADQWTAAFGVAVEIVPLGWERFVSMGQGSPGFDGAFRESWSGGYASADAYLHPLFHTSAVGQANFARFSDRSIDRFIDRQARETVDEADQDLDYRSVETRLCDRMPVVPVAFGAGAWLVRSSRLDAAGDVLFDRVTGLPNLREAYVR